MKKFSRAGMILGAMALWFGTPGQALAALDSFYPNSATWTVDAVADGAVTNAFVVGANGSTTLNTDVYAGDAIVVSAGWVIKDNSASPGTDTAYPRTVTFSAVTNTKPVGAPDVTVAAITSCPVASAATPCTTTISFTPPAAFFGGYQIQINTGTGGGGGQLNTRQLHINFVVAEEVAELIETTLTVAQQCYTLNQGDVDLTAKLEELLSGNAIANAEINFSLNASPIGSADTAADGVATLLHDITGLGVGDHNLYAEFEADGVYEGSNGSNTLGISYMFAGFSPPINGDGTSIFGGRVIPIKIRLFDANGVPVTDAAPTVWLKDLGDVMGMGTDLMQTTSVSAADTGNTMRYTSDSQQYIYNWDAKSLPNGTYHVVVQLGDSPTCSAGDPTAIITVAKKGKN